jgi:hypothetical protein
MSEENQPSIPGDPLDRFEAALRAAAISVNLRVTAAPELASSVFRGGEDAEAAQLSPSDLPPTARGLKLGRYAVVVGLLPQTPQTGDLAEALRRYRNQCVIARSYLSPNESLDLQLFLIGPSGSEGNADWHPLALIAERGDRVERKLVWLRPAERSADEASFGEFIKRTFLARPWRHEATFTMAALDNLNKRSNLAAGAVPRDTVGEWFRLALAEHEDAAALVDSLIAAWRSRGES